MTEATIAKAGAEQRDDALELESRRISRYLLGVDPSAELIERYRRAHVPLSIGPPTPHDRAALEMIQRRAWTLPCLDAASGILRPDSLLRRKVLLMFAILETSPDFAERFDAESPGRLKAVARMFGQGFVSLLQIAAGVALWPLVLARARLHRS